jgi:hypothetical protein
MIRAETIDCVTRFDGGKLPVVSVYLGLDANPQVADIQLRDHVAAADLRLPLSPKPGS